LPAKFRFSGGFYLYQLLVLIIWYFYAYYYMGLVLTVIIIGSGMVKVVVSEAAQKKVLEMATFVGYSKVFRDGRWTEIPSQQLVVGDVIEVIADGEPLSVDCVLLSGNAVVDESSLTGESLPVTKFELKDEDNSFSKNKNAKTNILFAGTMVLDVQRFDSAESVKALVIDTGGSTEKGKLVRDILYPVPFSFIFTEHLKIVVPLLILWGIVMLFAAMLMLEVSDLQSWFYGMFSISQVLSPVLPAVLVIGQSVSAERLRSKGIMCVDFNRITLAGKVKVFCFDKTGTLTKEGLEFCGVREVSKGNQISSTISEFNSMSYELKLAMQTCHSLSLAQNRTVGNFVDVEMFKATSASLDRGLNSIIHSSDHKQIRIERRYEFNHTHAYMSAICSDESENKSFIFLKGSYEKIITLSKSSSVPQNFLQVAKECAGQGYYVIAIAGKRLNQTEAADLAIKREDLEKDVSLLGIMLFRNELKPDTRNALQKLRDGGCRTVMITGDHQNTALYIAREASMFTKGSKIIMAEYQDHLVTWHDAESREQYTQSAVEKMITESKFNSSNIELVVTGDAFNSLLQSYWLAQHYTDVRVFARMKPMDKVKCVRLHMTNYVTAMCGDGGNDAGALKAAHAGIALSGSNSSVVSHFSSTDLSIESCVLLLREARCSLDVSFSSYKYNQFNLEC
jgi:cation-transporting ATPase 13A3/4/5